MPFPQGGVHSRLAGQWSTTIHFYGAVVDIIQEARTGVISLPEDAYTIEELLRHLYGLSLLHYEQKPDAMDAHTLLGLRIVADKVGLLVTKRRYKH